MANTARRPQGDALARDQANSALLLQLAAQGLGDAAALDASLRVVWLSGSFAARLGVAPDTAVGRNWFDLYPEAGSLAGDYARALAGEEVTLPLVPAPSDAGLRYRGITLRPWQVSSGDAPAAALFVAEQDVTATVRAAHEHLPELADQVAARRAALLQAVSRHSVDGLCAVDEHGKIQHLNEHFAELCGLDASAAIGRNAIEVVHPDDLSDLRPRLDRGELREGSERMRRLRFRVRDRAGGWRWLDCLAVNALSDPHVRCVLLYSRDATQEVLVEEQLRRRERRFAALTEKSDDLILVLDARGRPSFTSASVARILGYRPSELHRTGVLRRVHPSHRRRVFALGHALRQQQPRDERIEIMIREASGSWRWLEVAAVDLTDDPDVEGFLINARDITARKVAEMERDAALDGASVFVWEQNVATGQVRWLVRPESLFGLGELAEDHTSDAWNAATHPEDLPRVIEAYSRFQASGQTGFEVGYRIRTVDGSYRWMLDRGQLAATDPETGALLLRGVTIDVTEQRRMEDDLAQSRERFHLALECAAIGFYEWSLIDDVIEGSDHGCGMLDLFDADGRCPGSQLLARMHPDDVLAWQVARDRHLSGETEFAECRYRVRGEDNAWKWVFDRSQVVERDGRGRPLRMVGIFMDIDQTQRAQLALGETEARLSTAVWAADLGLWELDVASRRARWHSNWCEREDLHPCEGPDHVADWDAHIHPDDIGAAEAGFSAMLENRSDAYESEYRVRTRSGVWLWIQERSRAVRRDANGRPLRVIGTCINIHARKLAEQALRESQLQLHSIAVNSSDWLMLLDTQLRIRVANRSFRGIEPEQLVGMTAIEISRPDEREAMQRFFDGVLASDEVCERAQIVQDIRGQTRHILIRAQTIRHDGRAVAIALTATELTTVVRQQQQLELQARILDTMREGVVLVDDRNQVRLTNPAFDRLFASEAGRLVGKPIDALLGGDAPLRRGIELRTLRQLSTHHATPTEFECHRLDGTSFHAACVVTPIVIDGRNHRLAVLNDISERRVLEREILEVSNREQHRIGNDLHDGLGQELTGVALMLRALSTRVRREHPRALDEVDLIVELLNRSIHNTRTLARGLSPVSLERGGLIPALRTLVSGSREAYNVAISLRTRITQPLRIDEAAANHLYRIVQEAINNAIRHGRATRLVLQLTVDEQLVRISVHDNGRGLPPGGPPETGLGLRTMRYRASVTGGDVSVGNHRHGGTIVRCSIPHVVRDPQSLDTAHLRAHQRAHTRRGDPW